MSKRANIYQISYPSVRLRELWMYYSSPRFVMMPAASQNVTTVIGLVRLQRQIEPSLTTGACDLNQLEMESYVSSFRHHQSAITYSQCANCIWAQPTGYTSVNGSSLSPVDYMTCEPDPVLPR